MSAATLTPTKPVRAARQAAPKPGNVCIVHIGVHLSATMPLESGLQLVRIMAGAKIVERDFTNRHPSGEKYYEREQVGATELQIVEADQVTPLGAKPAPKESGVTP